MPVLIAELTPRHAVLGARAALCAGMAIVAVLTLTPALAGAEAGIGLTDKIAHFLAFYGLMSLSLLAFPGVRRNDMAMWLLAFAAGVEIAQGMIGRQASLSDMVANGAGVLAVIAPAMIERVRWQARRAPDATFADLAAEDGRTGEARPAAPLAHARTSG